VAGKIGSGTRLKHHTLAGAECFKRVPDPEIEHSLWEDKLSCCHRSSMGKKNMEVLLLVFYTPQSAEVIWAQIIAI
jgi:hypothetical protein